MHRAWPLNQTTRQLNQVHGAWADLLDLLKLHRQQMGDASQIFPASFLT